MKKKTPKEQNFSFATSTWKIIQKEKYQPIFYWHKNFQVQFNNGAKLLKFIWKKIWPNRKTKQFNSSSNVFKVHLFMKMLQIKKKEIFPKYYQLTWNVRLGNFLFFISLYYIKTTERYTKLTSKNLKNIQEYLQIAIHQMIHGSNHDTNDKNISMKHRKHKIM